MHFGQVDSGHGECRFKLKRMAGDAGQSISSNQLHPGIAKLLLGITVGEVGEIDFGKLVSRLEQFNEMSNIVLAELGHPRCHIGAN